MTRVRNDVATHRGIRRCWTQIINNEWQIDLTPNVNQAIDVNEDRYHAVRYNVPCQAAVLSEAEAHKQMVRNYLRATPMLALSTERAYLDRKITERNARFQRPSQDVLVRISEYCCTALRHKPFYQGDWSRRYLRQIVSFDQHDGWAEITDTNENLPEEWLKKKNYDFMQS